MAESKQRASSNADRQSKYFDSDKTVATVESHVYNSNKLKDILSKFKSAYKKTDSETKSEVGGRSRLNQSCNN